ncbi:hypothetical protein JAAARDRAFT_41257 [Jaapia argillacea MUCL 33604]|uniref:Uncharacterized protein n=1 Tax=Jaapia argillacea MUCL 33604 TaxID=933084 RepID=A0A067PLG4_9AGAM|nr:hypothetical protein JAAARDRAFT_41257 [Jaapia argillacea MUCL 33604]
MESEEQPLDETTERSLEKARFMPRENTGSLDPMKQIYSPIHDTDASFSTNAARV